MKYIFFRVILLPCSTIRRIIVWINVFALVLKVQREFEVLHCLHPFYDFLFT